MSAETEKAIAKVVRRIVLLDAQAWFELVAALKERSLELDTSLVNSAPDDVLYWQGRAREARLMLGEFQKAPQLGDDLIQRERANAHAARKP